MKVTVAATQFACTEDREQNLATAERMIRAAASKGANIILIQELFETPYFCKEHNPHYFDYARSIEESPAVRRFQELARELNVVLPASVYEREGNAFFNTVAIVDADGKAVVLTTTLEHAELKRDQIHAYGKDNLEGSKGSMWSTIEPVE